MTPRLQPRRCAECGKVIPPRKLATVVEVAPTPMLRGHWIMAYPLCSIACGAVAAVRLLEQVTA